MTRLMEFHARLLWRLLTRGVVSPELIRDDYDRLSGGYDEYFSSRMARHSRLMVERLGLASGGRALDLACGTGAVALAEAEKVGPSGEAIGVDSSPGMLAVMRRKAAERGLGNLRAIQGDAYPALEQAPDGSFDAVTCAWAIGYMDPLHVMRVARRKLRPGGRFGLIENRRSTLEPIRRTALKVAARFPRHLRLAMDLHFRLPKDAANVRRWFESAQLSPAAVWEGEEVFKFGSGAEALDWVLHTGASAGFDRMMDPAVKPQCDELFARLIERDFMSGGVIEIKHRFAAGIAVKEA